MLFKVDPKIVAERELQKAELDMLEALRCKEEWDARVAMLQARIERLKQC